MLINIDWLQIHCKGTLPRDKNIKYVHQGQTQQFLSFGDLLYKNKVVATVSMQPRTELSNGGMTSDTLLIKFKNKYLYQSPSELKKFIDSIMAKMPDVRIVGLSRIDVCADFNRFFDNYKPQDFIADFAACRILKNGRGEFKTQGKFNRDIIYHYLRFGSHTSERSIYLYNKTKELNANENKPHIRDAWNRDADINPIEDVWRLEISMKGNKQVLPVFHWTEDVTTEDLDQKKYTIKKQIVRYKAPSKRDIEKNDEAGANSYIELCDLIMHEAEHVLNEFNRTKSLPQGYNLFRRIRFDDLLDPQFLQDLYFTTVKQHFSFKVNDKTKNKSRMKDVMLFEDYATFTSILTLSESKDETRSNRIFVKHTHKHIQDLKGMNNVLKSELAGVDIDLLTNENDKAAFAELAALKIAIDGGEKALAKYVSIYGMEKYLAKIRQMFAE